MYIVDPRRWTWVMPQTHKCVLHIHTGWRRLIGSPKLQIIFHKRATKCRSFLRKITYKDKGSYESSPPCMSRTVHDLYLLMYHTYAACSTSHVWMTHTPWCTCTSQKMPHTHTGHVTHTQICPTAHMQYASRHTYEWPLFHDVHDPYRLMYICIT